MSSSRLKLTVSVTILIFVTACSGHHLDNPDNNIIEASAIPDNSDACFNSNYDSVYKQYAGRYKKDDFNIVNVEFKNGELHLSPLFWSSTQHLQIAAKDSFVCKTHERLSCKFHRNNSGEIISIELIGFSDEKEEYEKLNSAPEPLEEIYSGNISDPVRKLVAANKKDTADLVKIGEKLTYWLSTKGEIAKKYLMELINYYPDNAAIYSFLGDSYMYLDKRDSAIEYYQKALRTDSTVIMARLALKELKLIPWSQKQEKEKWSLPFELDELFKEPSQQEIKNVENEWRSRDLSPQPVTKAGEYSIMFGNIKAKVHVISHKVHGYIHYGAIVIPEGAENGKHPAIIELKGVSPGYGALIVNDGLESSPFLCNEANQFIYILPSYRGEKMIVNGKEYLSEGDRTDSWDGATDDALALLNAALSFFPQIDVNRIGVFGRSRGGSVALLAGIRDTRIKEVVALSAPTDWFINMGLDGWTQRELADMGLHIKSTNYDIGGQFIERILKKSIEGADGLAAARKRMIVSSPLYFIHRFRNVQVHYGIEDRIVPLVNGTSLVKRMKEKGFQLTGFQYFFHATEGHDTDKDIYYPNARKAFLTLLK